MGNNADLRDDRIPAIFDLFGDNVEIYFEDYIIVIETDNLPNHPSPYFETSDSRYKAYNGSNARFNQNPSTISEQTMTYRVPANPVEATNK